MLRFLQVNEIKPIKLMKAGADLKRGAVVADDFATDVVTAATGAGDYLVDVPKNYDGINALITPKEKDFEDIKTDALVQRIPTHLGERYATTEVTAAGLAVGDPLAATAGKFVKATSGTYQWVYCGPYADPTGLAMYIVERVSPTTV